MTHDNGLCISDQEWIKTRMKTPIHLNSNVNEVITRCSFSVGLCLLLSSHCHYMCYHCLCLLHHICVNWVGNDKVHQSIEAILGNKNIHSSLGVVREKVGDLFLNMCFALQSNSYNNTPKCVKGCYTFTPIGALKQMCT
jgi:hypothetical protein